MPQLWTFPSGDLCYRERPTPVIPKDPVKVSDVAGYDIRKIPVNGKFINRSFSFHTDAESAAEVKPQGMVNYFG